MYLPNIICFFFSDNEITIDLLTEIQDNDLKELVPLVKERILFRVGVRKLEKITHVSKPMISIIFNRYFNLTCW